MCLRYTQNLQRKVSLNVGQAISRAYAENADIEVTPVVVESWILQQNGSSALATCITIHGVNVTFLSLRWYVAPAAECELCLGQTSGTKLLKLLLCVCQAAKEDLMQQGWKGFYLGGNYVSGTPLSLTCCALYSCVLRKATAKPHGTFIAKPFKPTVQNFLCLYHR